MTTIQTPAQRFATILEGLKKVVAAAGVRRMPGAWILLIWTKINRISHQITRIGALVREGKYRPRQNSGKPRKPTTIRSPRAQPLSSKRGWLLRALPMLPGAPGAAPWRGYLETLLQDPDMVALIAAAPTLVRPIRSLCFMLLIPPPPVLALPARPRPSLPARPPAAPPAAAPSANPPSPPVALARSGTPPALRHVAPDATKIRLSAFCFCSSFIA